MLAILDYEAGNQTSVKRALNFLGIDSIITADSAVLSKASGIIFPGVGAAGQAMNLLQSRGLDKTLKKLIGDAKPLLGVCLGCQILLESSAESETKTMGIIKGRSLKFSTDLQDENGSPICIPHMGWNGCKLKRESVLFKGIPPDAEFYFVHSYYVETVPDLVIATTVHGFEFCSVYGRDGLWAVQFHPEKSGEAGLNILQNFNSYCLENS